MGGLMMRIGKRRARLVVAGVAVCGVVAALQITTSTNPAVGAVGYIAPQPEPEIGFGAGMRMIALRRGDSFAIDPITGEPGQPLPINVQIPDITEGAYNFLMFRYLPEEFKLSVGFRVEDRWVVSLADVDDLTLTSPNDYSGRFELEVRLRIGRTSMSEPITIPVDIRSPAAEPAPLASAAPAAPSVSPAVEDTMMQRAEGWIEKRDIPAARLLYIYLAERGSARGAHALAQTYDPAYLRRVGAAGLQPDIEQAKRWYQRAAELGNRDAEDRLRVLAAGTQ
jgi:hypothetical protein